jgi:hypothetical protein
MLIVCVIRLGLDNHDSCGNPGIGAGCSIAEGIWMYNVGFELRIAKLVLVLHEK